MCVYVESCVCVMVGLCCVGLCVCVFLCFFLCCVRLLGSLCFGYHGWCVVLVSGGVLLIAFVFVLCLFLCCVLYVLFRASVCVCCVTVVVYVCIRSRILFSFDVVSCWYCVYSCHVSWMCFCNVFTTVFSLRFFCMENP